MLGKDGSCLGMCLDDFLPQLRRPGSRIAYASTAGDYGLHGNNDQ